MDKKSFIELISEDVSKEHDAANRVLEKGEISISKIREDLQKEMSKSCSFIRQETAIKKALARMSKLFLELETKIN